MSPAGGHSLGAGTRKSDFVFCAIVVENKFSFRIGDFKIIDTQLPQTIHHSGTNLCLFRLGFPLSLGRIGFAVGLSCFLRTFFQFWVKFKQLRTTVDFFIPVSRRFGGGVPHTHRKNAREKSPFSQVFVDYHFTPHMSSIFYPFSPIFELFLVLHNTGLFFPPISCMIF